MALDASGHRREDLGRACLVVGGVLLGMFLAIRPAASQLDPYTVEYGLAATLALLFLLFHSVTAALLPGPSACLPDRLALAIALFGGVLLLGLLRSPNAGEGVPLAVDLVTFALLAAAGCVLCTRTPSHALWIARALTASGAAGALYGLGTLHVQLPRLRAHAEAGLLGQGEYSSQLALERIYSEEIFGSFEIANAFAAFLALTMLVQLGLWGHARARRGEDESVDARDLAHACMFGLQGLALYHTGSKGGWIAFAAGVWFFTAQALARDPVRKRFFVFATLGGIGLMVLTFALATSGAIDDRFLGLSMWMRFGYWRTGWNMIAAEPLLGIGLGGFGDAFTSFKTALATESRQAHNDWLQLWAELGILGPLAWGLLWYALLRPPRSEHSEPPVPQAGQDEAVRFGWAVPAGGLLGFLAILFAFDAMGASELWTYLGAPGVHESGPGSKADAWMPLGAAVALGVPVVFALAWLSAGKRPGHEDSAPAPALSWGLRAACGAILLHQMVDFDLKAPAVLAALGLCGGMAAGLSSRRDAAPGLLARVFPWLAAALALALLPTAAALLQSGYARQAAANEEDLMRHLAALKEDHGAAPIGLRERLEEIHRLHDSSVTLREDALRATEFDGKAVLDLAIAYMSLHEVQRKTWQPPEGGERAPFALALEQFANAEELRPLWHAPPARLSHHMLREAFACLRAGKNGPAGTMLEAAAWNARQAAQRYPRAPLFPVLEGDALLALGRTAHAARAYAAAWEADRAIYDRNVRFASVFHDPRPGCLPQHDLDPEMLALLNAAAAQAPPEDRFGLLVRSFLIFARARIQARAEKLPKEALRAADQRLAEVAEALARTAPEDGHAALFRAAALQLAKGDPEEVRQAWKAALDALAKTRQAGRPATQEIAVQDLRALLGGQRD